MSYIMQEQSFPPSSFRPEFPRSRELLDTVGIRDIILEDIPRIRTILESNILGSSRGHSLAPEIANQMFEYEQKEVEIYIEKMIQTLNTELNERERRYIVSTLHDSSGQETVAGVLGCIFDSSKMRTAIELRLSAPWGILACPDERSMLEQVIPEGAVTELINFYVDPEYQKKGIGSKMWQEMERWLGDQGYNQLFLSSRELWQAGAWKLYEKDAFRKFGVDYYRNIPCNLYMKLLNQTTFFEESSSTL